MSSLRLHIHKYILRLKQSYRRETHNYRINPFLDDYINDSSMKIGGMKLYDLKLNLIQINNKSAQNAIAKKIILTPTYKLETKYMNIIKGQISEKMAS